MNYEHAIKTLAPYITESNDLVKAVNALFAEDSDASDVTEQASEPFEDLPQIQAGLEVLDRIRPDWYKNIDLISLNMGSTYNCILGQVFQDENLANSDSSTPYGYGVNVLFDAGFDADENIFGMYHDSWVEAVRNRRRG